MKHIYLLVIAICCSIASVNAQNTLLVYTKWPSKLNFIDAFNKVIPVQNIWSEEEGGFVLSYEELATTYVTASDFASFKLSDQVKLTKLIALSKDSKISLQKCFTNEKYCCEKLTDKQKKGTEKLYAVALMKKGHSLNLPIVFDEKSTKGVNSLNDVFIKWESKLTVEKVYIIDVNTLETVFEKDAPQTSQLTYEDLKSASKDFLKNHHYQLSVVLKQANNTLVKHKFDFAFNDLTFNSDNYHISSKESFDISWKTDEKVKKIEVIDSVTNKTVWEKSDYKKSSISSEEMNNGLGDAVSAGSDYSVYITLENGQKYKYKFMILLEENELDALKSIVE